MSTHDNTLDRARELCELLPYETGAMAEAVGSITYCLAARGKLTEAEWRDIAARIGQRGQGHPVTGAASVH